MKTSQDTEQFKDVGLAINEVSRIFTCVTNHNHVFEAKSPGRMIFVQSVGRNFLNPFSRDPLVSPILNDTSVYLERAKPVVAASASPFKKKVRVATLVVPPTAAGTAAAFQATAPLLMSTEIISSKEVDPAGRNLLPTEGPNSIPLDSISQPQVSRNLPNITLPPPLETLRCSTRESPRMNLQSSVIGR